MGSDRLHVSVAQVPRSGLLAPVPRTTYRTLVGHSRGRGSDHPQPAHRGGDFVHRRYAAVRAAARRAQLSVTFHAEHGRPPTTVEQIALAQQATLETRPGKHPPRSLAEQRAQWRASAERLLGADGVQQMLADTLPRTRPSYPPLTGEALDRIGA